MKLRIKKKERKFIYRYRSSKTGEWVTEEYAKKHPATTERVKVYID